LKRRCLLPLILVVLLLSTAPWNLSRAQTFPARHITLIVPFAAGGTADIVGRLLASEFKSSVGQVVVENATGASGAIGVQRAARAAPDGYTLVLGTTDAPLNAYNKELRPVGMVAKAPILLLVRSDTPFKSAKDFIARAKERSGPLTVATSNVSSSLALLALETASGTKFQVTRFQGAGEMLVAVLGGHVDATLATPQVALDQVRGGQLRAIAVMSAQKSTFLPDVPTLVEQGFRDAILEYWIGLFAPANTPTEIIQTLNKAVVTALNQLAVRERLQSLYLQASPSSPEGFADSANQSGGGTTCGQNSCPTECKNGCKDNNCCTTMFPRP
jgi:tripartite-type tricarboxylate transporter receptor subunit TctC